MSTYAHSPENPGHATPYTPHPGHRKTGREQARADLKGKSYAQGQTALSAEPNTDPYADLDEIREADETAGMSKVPGATGWKPDLAADPNLTVEEYENPKNNRLHNTYGVPMPDGSKTYRVGTGSRALLVIPKGSKGGLVSTDFDHCGATVMKGVGQQGETVILLGHVTEDDPQKHMARLADDVKLMRSKGVVNIQVQLFVHDKADSNDVPSEAAVGEEIKAALGADVRVKVNRRPLQKGEQSHLVVTADGVTTHKGDFRAGEGQAVAEAHQPDVVVSPIIDVGGPRKAPAEKVAAKKPSGLVPTLRQRAELRQRATRLMSEDIHTMRERAAKATTEAERKRLNDQADVLEATCDQLAAQRAELEADIEVLEGRSAEGEAGKAHVRAKHGTAKPSTEIIERLPNGGWRVESDQVVHTTGDQVASSVNDQGQARSNQVHTQVGVGAGNASHKRTETEKKTDKNKTTETTRERERKVDVLNPSVSASDTVTHDNGKGTVAKKSEAVTLDATGLEKKTSEEVAKGDKKETDTRSTKLTRGDGKVGIKKGRERKKEDGAAGQTITTEAEGGVVFGGGKVGAHGGGQVKAEKKSKSGLKGGGYAGAYFTAYASVEKDPESGKYWVMLTVTVQAKAGASAGAETTSKTPGDKSGASAGVDLTGKLTASYRHLMDAQQTKAYLAALTGDAGGKGAGQHKEMATLAALKSAGDLDAARAVLGGAKAAVGSTEAVKDLPEGDAVQLETDAEATGKLDASAAKGGKNVGGGAAVTRGRKKNVFVQKKAGKIVVTVYIDGTEGWGVNASGGYGVASGKVAHTQKSTRGRTVKFVLDPASPNFDQQYKTITGAQTSSQLAQVTSELSAQVKENKANNKDEESTTVGAGVGPVGISITEGKSMEDIYEVGPDGELVRKIHGKNSIGGEFNVGSYKWGSSSEEGFEAEVDGDGDVAADMTTTRKNDDLTTWLTDVDDKVRNRTASMATGGDKASAETQEVDGYLVDTQNMKQFYSMAKQGRAAWRSHCNAHKVWPQWEQCRQAVVAAGNNKDWGGVAAAMAQFTSEARSKGSETFENLLRYSGDPQAGIKLTLPDGLGHLEGRLKSLVVFNPLKKAQKFAQNGAFKDAAAEAMSQYGKLVSLQSLLRTASTKIGGAIGELDQAIRRRQAECKAAERRWKAQAEGKAPPSKAQETKSSAVDDYNGAITACHQQKAAFMRVYSDLMAMAGDPGPSAARAKVDQYNELKILHTTWKADYATFTRLANEHGFTRGTSEDLCPATKYLQRAYATTQMGYDADEAREANYKEDMDAEDNKRREKDSEEFSHQLFKNSAASHEARAFVAHKEAQSKRAKEVAAVKAQFTGAIGKAMVDASTAQWPWNKRNKNGGSFSQQAKDAFNAGNAQYNAAHGEKAKFDLGVKQGWHPGPLTKQGNKALQAYRTSEATFKAGHWTLNT